MSKLEIKIPIRTFDREGKTAEYIKTRLSGIEFDWDFYGEKATFASSVNIIKKKDTIYRHELLWIKKMMEILPNNDNLKNDYRKYLELDKKAFIYDVEVVFKGGIAVEADIEDNSVLYYDGPKSKELKHRDIAFLRKHIKNEMLEDFYEEKIKRFILATVMTLVIAYPEIDINSATAIVSFDDNIYRKEHYFSCYPIHNDCIKEYKKLFNESVSFEDTLNWIKKYTSLVDENKKTPVIFSSLSYVFNREMHEILIYSIIALENIYAPNDKGISYTLQKNISTVFPEITKDMIKNLYKMRSKFVHGDISVGNYQLFEETIDSTRDYNEPTKLAIALLLATIRKLIVNDAISIKFSETISFEYK